MFNRAEPMRIVPSAGIEELNSSKKVPRNRIYAYLALVDQHGALPGNDVPTGESRTSWAGANPTRVRSTLGRPR
jgi:hypothetical protein